MKAVPTGIEHGTVTLVLDHHPFEVTTLREDVDTDGRHATVVFGRDFSHDARRRDFTMNALYADRHGVIEDHVGGIADIEARHVRFIGDPAQRIREDYLRILRLFRFHAHYGSGPLDAEALHAAIQLRGGLARLSAERDPRRVAEAARVPQCGRNRRRRSPSRAFSTAFWPGSATPGPSPRLADAGPGAARRRSSRLAALALWTGDDADRLHERLRLSNAEGLHLLQDRPDAGAPARHASAGRPHLLREWGYRLRQRHRPRRAGDHGRAPRRWPWPADLAEAAQVLERPAPRLPVRRRRRPRTRHRARPVVGAIVARAEALWIDAGFPGRRGDPRGHSGAGDAAILAK